MTDLSADCARCAALCCRLAFFERSADFAFTKPAGAPCRHLTKRNTCGVHARRLELGLSGCVAFDCSGAGQALSARLTADQPLGTQVAAFHALVEVHFALRLVELARRLGHSAQVAALEEKLLAHAALPVEALAELDTSGLRFVLPRVASGAQPAPERLEPREVEEEQPPHALELPPARPLE
jgi:hypothetical protein